MGTAMRRRPRSAPRPAEAPPTTSVRTLLWPYGAIFGAALVLRLLYVASIRQTYFFAHPQTEPLRYWQWGTLILDGTAPAPPYDEPPGYAYFVAAIFAGFGRSMAAIAHVQGVLDALSCALIGAIGTQWFGKRAGVFAGTFAAVYGPFIYFSGELLPNTLLIALAVAAIAAAVLPPRLRSTEAEAPRWLMSGTLWAVALAVRFEIITAYPFLAFDAWRRGRYRALLRAVLPGAMVILVLMGHGVSASWPKLLNSTVGLNFWIGNNPHSDGVNPFIFGPLQPVAEHIMRAAPDATTADRAFAAAAMTFWANEPRAAVRLLWKKFVWTWSSRELPNTTDIDWQTAQSWLFRLPLFPLGFGLLLPLALAGAVLVGTQWSKLGLLAGLIATGTSVPVLLFTNARFRLVMAPALLLLAGAACARLVDSRRQPQPRARLLCAAVAAVIGIIVSQGNFYGVRSYHAAQIDVNTGVLERAAGQFSAAVGHLRAGLGQDPTDSLAWGELAMALEQDGQSRAALETYFDGLSAAPDDRRLAQIAAWFFRRQGLGPQLVAAYQTAASTAAQQAVREDALRQFDARDTTRPAPR